jgi:hypothetical protein
LRAVQSCPRFGSRAHIDTRQCGAALTFLLLIPSARSLLATPPPLIMVWKPPTSHAGSREGECARVHFTSPSASREVRVVGNTPMTSRQRRQRRHKQCLHPWMVCRGFLGWSASSHELENARRRCRAVMRTGSETLERWKDTSSSHYGGGAKGRQRRPFAPCVTCRQSVTCVAGKFQDRG